MDLAHARVPPVDAHAGPALGVADADADAVHAEVQALRYGGRCRGEQERAHSREDAECHRRFW